MDIVDPGYDISGLADTLLAIGQDVAPRIEESLRSTDHGDLLYDEHGLPA